MRKLPVFMAGLAFIVASCAPNAATAPSTETSAPTVPPQDTARTQVPTATASTQEAVATTETQALSDADIDAPTAGSRDFQPQLEQISINLNEVVTLLPPDAIPAVLPDRAQDIMVSATEADATGIDQSVHVLGVEINGESRAYPIPFLSRHEIVNDSVGGRQIAVTW